MIKPRIALPAGALQPGIVERYARSTLPELTFPKTEGDHRESLPCSAASSPAGRSSGPPSLWLAGWGVVMASRIG